VKEAECQLSFYQNHTKKIKKKKEIIMDFIYTVYYKMQQLYGEAPLKKRGGGKSFITKGLYLRMGEANGRN